MKKTIPLCLALFFSLSSMGATIIFKSGAKISKVKLISIANGMVTIEKDKAQKSYRLKLLKAYYLTDIESSNNAIPDEYAKYKITVFNIKAPKKGTDIKKRTSKFSFGYNISRSKGSSKKIRAPYFYLYILTHGKDEYSHRHIYKYYKPKMAKPKGKSYDVAAILTKLNDFKRPIWHSDRKNLHGGIAGRKIEFPLKGVKSKKVLAWRLEVWGDSELLYQKTEKQYPEVKIGKNWWRRLKD